MSARGVRTGEADPGLGPAPDPAPGPGPAPGPALDPIEAHVADLTAVLHGPGRVKSRMVAELREGLVEAARDLSPVTPAQSITPAQPVEPGRPDPCAARQAIDEFGSVAELAPSFQRELTVAQARHTARTVMLVVPLLLLCWYGVAHWDGAAGRQLPGPVQVLMAHLGGVAATAAFLAAVALVVTGALARRFPTPHRLPFVVAWSGTAAAVALAVSALTLVLASVLAANWPLSVAAGVVTLVFHAKIAASARACRECARLPLREPVPQG